MLRYDAKVWKTFFLFVVKFHPFFFFLLHSTLLSYTAAITFDTVADVSVEASGYMRKKVERTANQFSEHSEKKELMCILGKNLLIWNGEWIWDKVDVFLVNISENCTNLILPQRRVEWIDNEDELYFRVGHVAVAETRIETNTEKNMNALFSQSPSSPLIDRLSSSVLNKNSKFNSHFIILRCIEESLDGLQKCREERERER